MMARYRSSGVNATQLLLLHIKAEKLPKPELEYRFHPTRRWRFDMAWAIDLRRRGGPIAVEIDGGVWVRGRHNTGAGFVKDIEKLNAAVELGWCVFRFTPDMVYNGTAIRLLKRVLT